jgi:two-component system chemotaxis response regulator CheB
MHQTHPDIIAIGASAGGIDPICALLSRFPADLPAAVLVVLHRSPSRRSHLASVIRAHAHMRVRIAEDGAVLEPGICLVSPPDRHLTVTPGLHIQLAHDSFYRAHNIDVLFNSLARCAGPRCIGVILSGLLKDGALGLKAIKEAGGTTLVQSPSEAEGTRAADARHPDGYLLDLAQVQVVGAQEFRRDVEPRSVRAGLAGCRRPSRRAQ